MKKIIALLLAAIMVLGLAACASKTENTEASDVKNVVYIVNGNLGDKSFFDSAQAGIDELVKAGRITCKTIELGGTDEDQPKWLSTLYDVSQSGEYDLVICGTYQMPDYLKEVATQYPDQLYLIFDDNTYAGNNSNVVNITYKQNDMGYLVGTYAACMTTDTNLDKINEDAVVGFVGGVDSPVINDFLTGFIEGALAVNPDIKVDTRYTNDYVDTAIAKEFGYSMINDNKCDIIWGVAGNAPDDVALVVVDHGVAELLGDGGVNVVVGVAGVDLDVGVDGQSALNEAGQEVVDDRGVNAADEADDCVLVDLVEVRVSGHAGGVGADQIAHVVLLVGDVDNVGVVAGIGVVVEDQVELIGILRSDFLQVVGHLVGAADDEVILAGLGNVVQRGQPLRLVFVGAAELDGLAGDAACFDQLVDAGLCGVEEGLVAQVAVDDVDDVLDVRGFCVLRLGSAGRQTENHDCCEQQCDDLFHVCSSIMFNLYDCGDKIPMIIVQD